MNKNWTGIMTVLEIQHRRKNKILHEEKNILNILHAGGEEFLLRAAFSGGKVSSVIPENYYMGLDNRAEIIAANTMSSLVGEPGTSGYVRQVVSSAGDFTVTLENGFYRATSPIVAFRAVGGTWGPVQNVFLSTTSDNSGYLISTSKLDSAFTVIDGDAITLRIGLSMKDCSSED